MGLRKKQLLGSHGTMFPMAKELVGRTAGNDVDEHPFRAHVGQKFAIELEISVQYQAAFLKVVCVQFRADALPD